MKPFTLHMNRRSGVSMIEFAFILPVFALMMMGVLEFGVSFLKAQSMQRNLGSVALAVQANPTNIENFNLANSNTALIDFSESGNFICAQSYETLEAAQAGNCSGSQWVTSPPTPSATSYFVMLKGQASRAAVTGIMDTFIGDISDRQVIAVGAGGSVCGAGEVQVSDGVGGFNCQLVNTSNMCNGEDLAGRTCTCTSSSVSRNNSSNTSFGCDFDRTPNPNLSSPASGFAVCTSPGWRCMSSGWTTGTASTSFDDQTR